MKIPSALTYMKRAAIDAGEKLLRIQPNAQRLQSRKDFLSDADLVAEQTILDILTNEYPDISAFSEEKGGERSREGFQWVIDPIDGTINFFLQDENWAVSIALVENGETVAGVVYCPAWKRLYSATSATPSKCLELMTGIETPIFVNDAAVLAETQVWWEWGKEESGGADHEKVHKISRALDRASLYPQVRNSAAADSIAVARGRISGLVFLKPDPFDIAAAGLIVRNAGGTVTDVEGNPWNAFSSSFIASNGKIHADLLRVISETLQK